MAETDRFKLTFAGEALTDHSIDVQELAPSLLALGDLLQEANFVVTNGKANIKLRVRANFEGGSFEVALEVVHSGWNQLVDLLSGEESSAIANLLAILGVSAFGAAPGLIDFIRQARGRKITNRIKLSPDEFLIEFEDGDPIQITRMLAELIQRPKVASSAYRMIKPLEREGIDEMHFSYEGEETTRITSDEVESFEPEGDPQDESTYEMETWVRVVSVSFDPRQKWRVDDGSGNEWVTISDELYRQRVFEDKTERFGSADMLKVRMKVTQFLVDNQPKKSFEIVEVLEHTSTPKQSNLWDTEETDDDEISDTTP